jgi:hypothetical protein
MRQPAKLLSSVGWRVSAGWRALRASCGPGSLLAPVAILLLVLAAPMAARGQSGGPYTLRGFTVAGGARSSGGAYGLAGSVGQGAAGDELAGGIYTLRGGFWATVGQAATQAYPIYLPIVLKPA